MSLMQNDLVNIFLSSEIKPHSYTFLPLLKIGSCGLARCEALIESQRALKGCCIWKEIQLKSLFFLKELCVYASVHIFLLILYH